VRNHGYIAVNDGAGSEPHGSDVGVTYKELSFARDLHHVFYNIKK